MIAVTMKVSFNQSRKTKKTKCTFSSVYLTQSTFVVRRTPISCVGDVILPGKGARGLCDALIFQ